MSIELKLAYHMGYEDALARRSPDSSKVDDMDKGTCRNVSKWTNVFECSECGFDYDFITDPYQGPRYCPNCGRKVVDA